MNFVLYLASYVFLLCASFSLVHLRVFYAKDGCFLNSTATESSIDYIATGYGSKTDDFIQRFVKVVPTYLFLNWIAVIPGLFSLFAFVHIPIYALVASLSLSNYFALLVVLPGSLRCNPLFNDYMAFLHEHWFLLLAISALLCVFGGLLFGLLQNSSPSGTRTSLMKAKKRRSKNNIQKLTSAEEKQFSVDVDILENEMIYLQRLSPPTPSLYCPTTEIDPGYLSMLPVWIFTISENGIEMAYSSTASDYDSCTDDGINKHALRSAISDECSICLEAYKSGDELTALSCFHAFHVQCIMSWIVGQEKHRCPICRWPSFIEKKQFYSVLASHNAK